MPLVVSGDVSALSCDSVYPPVCVSNLGGSNFLCDFTFEGYMKSCLLSTFLVLYLLEWSDDFQLPDMLDRKPEVDACVLTMPGVSLSRKSLLYLQKTNLTPFFRRSRGGC